MIQAFCAVSLSVVQNVKALLRRGTAREFMGMYLEAYQGKRRHPLSQHTVLFSTSGPLSWVCALRPSHQCTTRALLSTSTILNGDAGGMLQGVTVRTLFVCWVVGAGPPRFSDFHDVMVLEPTNKTALDGLRRLEQAGVLQA